MINTKFFLISHKMKQKDETATEDTAEYRRRGQHLQTLEMAKDLVLR